jgi:dipeptidyl aminopeptidase/acylaminoacyl peptidase
MSGYDRWYFRDDIEADWTLLEETNPLEFSEPLRPVGFGEDLSVLYHLAPAGGVWGLHTLVPVEEPIDQEVFSHPLFDIELIDTMGPYGRVVAAAYLDERPQRFVVDERVRNVYNAAAVEFPAHNIEVIDESRDGSKYLLLVRPPRRAGVYYLFDRNDGSFSTIGAMYDHLADVELAATQSVSFPAADGGTISGHLTLPHDPGGTVPVVIIPRSRASRLDLEDPHYLVQYLAARGYAVLRVNNRGPEEYNGSWLADRTAFAWERAAADIDAAMHYLIGQGVADEGRICTLGRDVGAYAAFMNAIEYPGVMDCVIGIGAAATATIGDWSTVIAGEFSTLQKDSSPIRRNKDWDASVLLFHGQFDEIVPILPNSANLARSLDRKDFDVSFVEYEYARHDIKREPYRIDMLTRIGEFLDARIGG